MVVADKDVARIPITVIFFLSSAQFMKCFPTAWDFHQMQLLTYNEKWFSTSIRLALYNMIGEERKKRQIPHLN